MASAGESELRGTDAEFEEILVVTDSKDQEPSAFRRDDDLPHVRRRADDSCRVSTLGDSHEKESA